MDIELPNPATIQDEQAHNLNDHAMKQLELGFPPDGVLAMLRRALRLMPKSAAIWSNIGLVLWRKDDIVNARNAFLEAIRIEKSNHIYHSNFGVFSSSTGDGESAEEHLTEAIKLKPEALTPQWDLALMHLWKGNWDKGLPAYDVRRAHRGTKLYPIMPYPMWDGEDLTDKTIYIQGEQGVGDRILLSRYLAWLKQRWPTCRILTCMNDRLINLFWEYREIVEFLPEGVPWPKDVDYGCYLATLPQHHGSTPNNVPPDPGYLKLRAKHDSTRCNLPEPRLPSVKVGICWTGNPDQIRNAERSIPLEQLLTLAEDPRISLYSVQCSPGSADIDRLGVSEMIQNLGPGIEKEGWVGTAIILMQFDVIITVCTSVAHLAGALGLNCWTLLCRDPYWIWPRASRETLWYPGMRLFRQRTFADWAPVIAEVQAELTKLADKLDA